MSIDMSKTNKLLKAITKEATREKRDNIKTCFTDKFTGEDFYNLAKKKYCAEFDIKDESKDGEIYFTHDGEYVDYRNFIFFLRGFEAINHCVENGELVYIEKEK